MVLCACRRKDAFPLLRHSGSLTRKSIIEVHIASRLYHLVCLIFCMHILKVQQQAYITLRLYSAVCLRHTGLLLCSKHVSVPFQSALDKAGEAQKEMESIPEAPAMLDSRISAGSSSDQS